MPSIVGANQRCMTSWRSAWAFWRAGALSAICLATGAICSTAHTHHSPIARLRQFLHHVFGGVHFSIWSYCLLRVLSDTWALRCVTFIFCVKEADLGTMALVAYFAPWFSHWYSMSFHMYPAQGNA